MEYIGELAGFSTAILWAMTSIFFSEAGKSIGSFYVNKIRLLIAVIIYCLILQFSTGFFLPLGLNPEQVMWLGLSGLVGLVIGDGCGFKALVMIGPRLTSLVYSTAPIMTTIIAWFWLTEQLGWLDMVGISATIFGVIWVVSERRYNNGSESIVAHDHPDAGSLVKGVLYALAAAMGQAGGLVLAKYAMFDLGGRVEPLEASFTRMAVAMVVIWTLSMFRGTLPKVLVFLRHRRAMKMCFGGAVAGPVLGVWMSLVAIKYMETGIAATLNAMTPVMILPLLWLVYRQKVSVRSVVGSAVAVAGVALLVLS